MTKPELQAKIDKLEKGINNPAMPENMKEGMTNQVAKLKAQLDSMGEEPKEEKTETVKEKGKRGRKAGSKNKVKEGAVPKVPKEKGKKGRPAGSKNKKGKAEKPVKEKPAKKYTPVASGADGEPDCDELLKRWQDRREDAKKAGRKRKTTPIFRKVTADVGDSVMKAVTNISKQEMKDNPTKVFAKVENLMKAAEAFLKEFKSILGDDYDTEARDKELRIIEKMIEKLKKKYSA